MEDLTASVVIFLNTGRTRRISVKQCGKIPEQGRQLLKDLKLGESVADACLCAKDGAVLFLSRQGKGLLVDAAHLSMVKSAPVVPCEGMQFREKDQAAKCISYEKNQEYLIVAASGQVSCMDREFNLLAHGRQGYGVAIAKIEVNDQVVGIMKPQGALILISGRGRALCIADQDVRRTKAAAAGVETLKMRRGQRVVAAYPMTLVLNETEEGS